MKTITEEIKEPVKKLLKMKREQLSEESVQEQEEKATEIENNSEIEEENFDELQDEPIEEENIEHQHKKNQYRGSTPIIEENEEQQIGTSKQQWSNRWQNNTGTNTWGIKERNNKNTELEIEKRKFRKYINHHYN